MKPIKVRGLVLREYEAGESDKRIMIFCKGQGRLMVYARGARKASSKFMAAAQLFTYADFVLVQGRGFYSLTQADIIESFYPLREDYDRLMAAHLIAEACEKTLWDDIESDALLLLALRSLSVLARGKIAPLQVVCVFLMRFFDAYGLRPQTDACVICNAPIDGTPLTTTMGGKFKICTEGLMCPSHSHQVGSLDMPSTAQYRYLSAQGVLALQYVLDSDLPQAFQFNVHISVLQELRNAANFLWVSHFEWEFRAGFV